MFGFLMGTLQKFKENEDAVKQTEKVGDRENNSMFFIPEYKHLHVIRYTTSSCEMSLRWTKSHNAVFYSPLFLPLATIGEASAGNWREAAASGGGREGGGHAGEEGALWAPEGPADQAGSPRDSHGHCTDGETHYPLYH